MAAETKQEMKLNRAFALLVIAILLAGFLFQLGPAGRLKAAPESSAALFHSYASQSIKGVSAPSSNYPVTFTENGLPKGTTWSVVVDGQTYTSSTTSISDIPIQYGTHTYSVPTITFGQEIKYVPDNSSGNMNIPADLYMNFNFTTYYLVSLATSPNSSGTTIPVLGNQSWYVAGSSVNITATPNTGYNFLNWFASPAFTIKNASLPSTTVTIFGPGTITANFSKETITNTTTSTTTTTNSTTSTVTSSESNTTSTNSSKTLTSSTYTSMNSSSTGVSSITSITTSSNETAISNSTASSTKTASTTTVQGAGYIYVPFVSKSPPTILGLSIFSVIICVVIGGLVAILQSRKKKTSSEGSSARGWRW